MMEVCPGPRTCCQTGSVGRCGRMQMPLPVSRTCTRPQLVHTPDSSYKRALRCFLTSCVTAPVGCSRRQRTCRPGSQQRLHHYQLWSRHFWPMSTHTATQVKNVLCLMHRRASSKWQRFSGSPRGAALRMSHAHTLNAGSSNTRA